MKVLILGSNGMAGHVMSKFLKDKGHEVHGAARNNAPKYIEVENQDSIVQCIKGDYDYVINCIGLLIKESNENLAKALLINSWFPHYLETLLSKEKTKLIHLSTDCVFNGVKGNYIETDIHDETNHYGKSKSIGEVNNNKDITFRMSIIGPELKSNGTGLLHWVLNNKDESLPGWENALWSGITTLQLAKCVHTYMLNPKITGVYNLVEEHNQINKFELLSLINEVYGLNKTIIKTRGPKDINKVLIDTRKEMDFKIPKYHSMLTEMRNYNL